MNTAKRQMRSNYKGQLVPIQYGSPKHNYKFLVEDKDCSLVDLVGILSLNNSSILKNENFAVRID